MTELTMQELIINMMAQANKTELTIPFIQRGVDQIMQNIKTEDYNLQQVGAKFSDIISVLVTCPGRFKLKRGEMETLYLTSEERLTEYAQRYILPEEVANIITWYTNSYVMEGKKHTEFMNSEKEARRETIKRDTKYINWLCTKLTKEGHSNCITDRDYIIAINGEELANIIMIADLYDVVRKYADKNFIPHYQGDTSSTENIIIMHRINGDPVYMKIGKTFIGVDMVPGYEVVRIDETSEAIYFPDIMLDIPNKDIEAKKHLLRDVRKQLKKAKELGLDIEILHKTVNEVYGKTQ